MEMDSRVKLSRLALLSMFLERLETEAALLFPSLFRSCTPRAPVPLLTDPVRLLTDPVRGRYGGDLPRLLGEPDPLPSPGPSILMLGVPGVLLSMEPCFLLEASPPEPCRLCGPPLPPAPAPIRGMDTEGPSLRVLGGDVWTVSNDVP